MAMAWSTEYSELSMPMPVKLQMGCWKTHLQRDLKSEVQGTSH